MNKIKFIAKQKYIYEFFERPYSAKQKYPEWLRKMPIFFSNKKVDDFGDPLETVKKCMPFYDAMIAGYHIPLPCDVWVDKQNNDYKIQWSVDQFDLISRHYDGQMDDKMIHDDYDKMLFKFNNPWIIKTPKNWSCLFTHPIHQDDVPFKSFTGFVDTDKFPRPVGIPFIIKKDFENNLNAIRGSKKTKELFNIFCLNRMIAIFFFKFFIKNIIVFKIIKIYIILKKYYKNNYLNFY